VCAAPEFLNSRTGQRLREKCSLATSHAVNAAIRRAGLEGRRKTNPVVDGQLVPKKRKANGHGEKSLRKRRREEAAPATPSTRGRRR
jgi:hypothetical protein